MKDADYLAGIAKRTLGGPDMNTTKHTPGPWAIDGGVSKGGDLFIWQAGEYFGGHALARVYYAAPGDTEANARLIAQAPYMKTALEELVAEFDEANRRSMERGEGFLRDTAGIALARHALELIEGR